MTLVRIMPVLNASLNALTGLLLLTGYVLVRRRRLVLHRRFMLAACTTSIIFLACYVLNHVLRHGIVTRFTGTGPIRPIYFALLISHTILAITIVPLAIITVRNGLKGRIGPHRRIARWTFPLWMYVSVTGVLVYFFLYHWYAPVTS